MVATAHLVCSVDLWTSRQTLTLKAYVMQDTHLQALFVYADHHLLVQTLHAELHIQNGPLIVQIFILPRPVRANGQGMEIHRQGWREWKRQTGAPRHRSISWLRTRVAQDGQIRKWSALQTIHHIWKSHSFMRLTYRLSVTATSLFLRYLVLSVGYWSGWPQECWCRL